MGRIRDKKKKKEPLDLQKHNKAITNSRKKQTSDKDYGICIFSDISGNSNNTENANTEHRFN